MIYMDGILNSYRKQEPTMISKVGQVFTVGYQLRWNMMKEFSSVYQEMGLFMSAYELLNDVELTDEAIKCLYIAGKATQAIKLAERLMQDSLSQPTVPYDPNDTSRKLKSVNQANLICLMGEMKKDKDLFIRAWEESGHRCAKAMRYLGKVHYYDKNYEEAIECFEKSFKINRLYKSEWFMTGCCYMRLEKM